MIPLRTSVTLIDPPGATIGIILALVVLYLFQASLPPDVAERFVMNNALVPARYADPAAVARWNLAPDNYLPFFTNAFMHADAWHLLVNAWALWVYGSALEQRLGMLRLVVLYLLAGIAASAAHAVAHPTSVVPALGASGAVAGVLGGFAFAYPRERVTTIALPVPRLVRWPALAFVIVWAALQAIMGIADLAAPTAPEKAAGGVAWWAHVGGFIAGLALGRLLTITRKEVRAIGPALGGVRAIGQARQAAVTIGGGRGAGAVVAAPAAVNAIKSLEQARPASSSRTSSRSPWRAATAKAPWFRGGK